MIGIGIVIEQWLMIRWKERGQLILNGWYFLPEPRMKKQMVKVYSCVGIWTEDPFDEVFGVGSEMWWDEIFCVFDFLEEFVDVFFVEGQVAGEQGEQDHSAWPRVHFAAAVLFPRYHLGRRVVRTPARSLQGLPVSHQVRQSEVSQLYLSQVFAQQYVLRLQVSMRHQIVMAIAHCPHYLNEVVSSLTLIQFTLLLLYYLYYILSHHIIFIYLLISHHIYYITSYYIISYHMLYLFTFWAIKSNNSPPLTYSIITKISYWVSKTSYNLMIFTWLNNLKFRISIFILSLILLDLIFFLFIIFIATIVFVISC